MRGLFMSCAAAATTPAASARPAIPNRNMTLQYLAGAVAATSGHESSIAAAGDSAKYVKKNDLQCCKWVAPSSSSRVREINTSVLGALDVGAVRGHDHDFRPRADEGRNHGAHAIRQQRGLVGGGGGLDRKSTRLNSSHLG